LAVDKVKRPKLKELVMNIGDMETTDDKSMVKVIMTDPGMSSSEPFRYVDIDTAFRLEANGQCIIQRKNMVSAEYEKTSDGKILVEHLEEPLIRSYGKFGAYTHADAELGERNRKWRRVRRGEKLTGYDDKMMVARPNTITREDLYGDRRTYETKSLKKKHVAWVQDSFLRGGAEISAETVIRAGEDCGFQIDMVNPGQPSEVIAKSIQAVDIIILNNLFGFSQEQLNVFDKAHKPYVKYEHDHRELARPAFSKGLFANSVLNVFLSPAHFKNHQEALGCEGIALPLAIDVDRFKPIPGVERISGTALISNCRNFKSWTKLQAFIDDHKEMIFTILTDKGAPIHGANVRTKPMVPYEEMPRVYSEHEHLVHLLDGWGAGERVIFEAALCGTKVISDERSGHMSWERDLMDTDGLEEWLRAAPYQFWKNIEAVA
jgi:hypothetical protein